MEGVPLNSLPCPKCGRSANDGQLSAGLCPVCLLALGLDDGRYDAGSGLSASTTIDATYRVLTVLAGDECRTTYLAEQRAPSSRLVTIEVVRSGTGAAITPAKFDATLKALRQRTGPGIAHVLDGLVTPTGDCCVIAEYVPGPRLDRYCERQRLELVERLRLFSTVCLTIEHAHSDGVVHGRLAPEFVVCALRARAVPTVTGFGACRDAATPVDDVTGLAALLAAVAGADFLASRAPGEFDPTMHFTSAAALRKAVEAVCGDAKDGGR